MLARGPRFSFADWVLSTAVVDVDALAAPKPRVFSTSARGPLADSEAGSIAAEFDFPSVTGTGRINDRFSAARSTEKISASVPGHPAWETGPHQKEEEFARAVALALFDYLRKSRSQGFVVSLSGGADSSAVAVLIHLLVQFGGRELGFDKLAEKLPHIKSLAGMKSTPTRRARASSANC